MKIKKIAQTPGVVATVVDNLHSGSSKDALSANQGKILNESIVNILNALVANGTNGRSSCIDSQDVNTITNNGFYYGNGLVNAPTKYGYLLVISHYSSSAYAVQIFTHQTSGDNVSIYVRQCDAGSWGNWRQFSLI